MSGPQMSDIVIYRNLKIKIEKCQQTSKMHVMHNTKYVFLFFIY